MITTCINIKEERYQLYTNSLRYLNKVIFPNSFEITLTLKQNKFITRTLNPIIYKRLMHNDQLKCKDELCFGN